MNKQYGYSYEVRINIKDYTYITANGAFYDFRGERLLYSTFDSILVGDSLKKLDEQVRSKSFNKIFIMDFLTRDDTTCPMVCFLEEEEDPDTVRVYMIEAEKMSRRYLELGMKQQITSAQLSQFDSVYFIYDRAENSITCYRYNEKAENILFKAALNDWHEQVSHALSEDSLDELAKFDANLKNGIRNFAGSFSNKSGEENIRYVGTAIYDEDIHIKTVGNIGSTNIRPMQDTVRRDQLTGLILKEDITNYCKKLMSSKEKKCALAIIDIDNFKNVNDHFGHSMGDVVLKKCAAIINGETGNYGKAGRIGGDEFLVVIDSFTITEDVKNVFRGIKNNIFQAYTEEHDGFHVSTSIGAAIFPDDADNFNTLFDLADHLLYRAKQKGKNRYIIYDPEKHGTVEEVLQTDVKEVGVSGRRGLSKTEAVCHIIDIDQCGEEYSLESILNDILEYFIIERVIIYNKTDRKVEVQRGIESLTSEVIYDTIDYLYDDDLKQFYTDNIMVINNIKSFQAKKCQKLYDKMMDQGIFSVMHHEITGNSGKVFVISYEMITKNVDWNMEDTYLYRLLDTIFKKRL